MLILLIIALVIVYCQYLFRLNIDNSSEDYLFIWYGRKTRKYIKFEK